LTLITRVHWQWLGLDILWHCGTYIMATISSVRSVRWCAVVQGTERFRLSRKYIYCLWPQQFFKIEPSSKLLCLFILWIHRNWLDRNCLFRVHTVTESGFRFETETGFDKWITPLIEIPSKEMQSVNNVPKQYIGAYTEPAHKNPDIRIWREKSSRKSGFAKVERICKHYLTAEVDFSHPAARSLSTRLNIFHWT